MNDMTSGIPQAVADFAAKMAAKPLWPESSTAETLHIGATELPWAEPGDGSAVQLLHVDLRQGLWILKMRLPPGYKVEKHFHTGMVYAVTLQGRWYYAESPDAVCAPGSYLFEPAASVHTLMTPADQDGDTIVWFAVQGANINLDEDGNVVSVVDARNALDLYRGYCDALGREYSKLIVIGD